MAVPHVAIAAVADTGSVRHPPMPRPPGTHDPVAAAHPNPAVPTRLQIDLPLSSVSLTVGQTSFIALNPHRPHRPWTAASFNMA